MISLKSLAELYDILYEQADAVLRTHNPCQFDGDRCIRDRSDGGLSRAGCCSEKPCDHLGPNGCKVKALRCKTFLCEYLKDKPYEKIATSELKTTKLKMMNCIAAMTTIEGLADKAFNKDGYTPSLGYFKSKKEVLEGLKDKRKQRGPR